MRPRRWSRRVGSSRDRDPDRPGARLLGGLRCPNNEAWTRVVARGGAVREANHDAEGAGRASAVRRESIEPPSRGFSASKSLIPL